MNSSSSSEEMLGRTRSVLQILTLLSSDPLAIKRESEEKAMSETPVHLKEDEVSSRGREGGREEDQTTS